MTLKHIRIRFILMQFLLWFTFGTFGIFYVAYLKDLGYSSKFIALGLTLSTTLGIGAQYLWGYISDLTSKIKTIFLALLVGLIAVVVGFPYVVNSPYLTLIFMMLFGVTWMPLEALLDSWILSTDGLPHSAYGGIRAGGSLGFSVITVFFGSMIVRYGFNISIWAFALSGALLFLTGITTRTHTSKEPTPMGRQQIKELMTNYQYVSILIFSILIFINHMGINNFYIYVVQQVGGDESLIGMSASIAAFTEIFGFFIGGKLIKKFNPLLILIFVAVSSLARVYFLSTAMTYVGVLVTASIQGLAFSLFLGTFKVYISEITPIALLASAQTIGASTYFGIASIIANIFGGILIDDYGMPTYYRFMIIMSGIAVVYSLILYSISRRNKST